MNWYYPGWTEENNCYRLRKNVESKEINGCSEVLHSLRSGNKISVLKIFRVCLFVLPVQVGCREGWEVDSFQSEEKI
jgi:hypothetical protein